jgi:hypothetical protein
MDLHPGRSDGSLNAVGQINLISIYGAQIIQLQSVSQLCLTSRTIVIATAGTMFAIWWAS